MLTIALYPGAACLSVQLVATLLFTRWPKSYLWSEAARSDPAFLAHQAACARTTCEMRACASPHRRRHTHARARAQVVALPLMIATSFAPPACG